MMRFTPALVLLALAACAAEAPPDDLRARQTAACTTAIAAHIGRPESEVRARWLSETGGIAQVETLDSHRRHLCQVDAGARVLSYSHPRS